jgi:hypothetical protein
MIKYTYMDRAFQRIALAAAVAATSAGETAFAQDRVTGNDVLPFAEQVLGPGVLEDPSLRESAAIGARLGRHGYQRFTRELGRLRSETDRQCARVFEDPSDLLDATVDLRDALTDFGEYSRARAANGTQHMNLRLCLDPHFGQDEDR